MTTDQAYFVYNRVKRELVKRRTGVCQVRVEDVDVATAPWIHNYNNEKKIGKVHFLVNPAYFK
jgi:hypothetical protein